jgi:hypothetical protein
MGEGVSLDRGEWAGVASGEGEDPHGPAQPRHGRLSGTALRVPLNKWGNPA